ncbi:DUF5333 domain-containing protein [Roseibacterium sp. SDUM158016]|jgi:hypothetical protein|uniref:DUF5333 domain-containing protein n=1 Tax=Roseicyclus sediminis TaxID=2980997 RepID=UPI0021CE3976|nr:DUF5333 domain-containing protein [Roseibacterium sp. SDUM158016]MCU4654600.1 DUF5333 domain-containing protein [Roseibacterium sp. SDUM158016]
MKAEIATVWACVLVVVFALATSAGSARADQWEALRNDERVHNGLLMIAIGRHIELTCPTIERRTIAAGAFLLGLANHAMSLGYSRAEVTDYVEDDTEQERIIAIARQYFADRGVASLEDVEGACRVGRDEITAGSQIGRLLREG